MGQRNMLCTSQMLDLEIDQQGQGSLLPEPCTLFRNITNYPHPNIHARLSASGNTSNLDLHHFTERHDSAIFHGTQYNGLLHHQHPIANLDLSGGGGASNFYNPYMMPSIDGRICLGPLNHGSSDQLPSSSNNGIIEVGIGEYERDSSFVDGVMGSCKRKNAGVPGSHQYNNGSASTSSSSLGAPLNPRLHQWEDHLESGVAVLDAVALSQPEPRGNGIVSITESGPRRCVRSRSRAIQLDSALVHNRNRLVQGNYMGQSFQPASNTWVDQHFWSNSGERGTPMWNYTPGLPYLHGSSVNGGSLEIGSVGGHGYQDTASSRSSTVLLHPMHQFHHHHHYHHHLPPPMQGMQGHNFNYHTQVPTASYRHPRGNPLVHHGSINPSQGVRETGPRYPRTFPPTGLRIYRPHRRGVPQAALEDSNRPRLRFLSADEVAILELPGFYEVGNLIDHHRDMRLDIDDMSYEELLALEEHIGNVNTGLSEETFVRHLKTRTHVSSAPPCNLEESASMNEETDTCIICQVEYENQEKIGILECGHEYHADCIKKWLLIKNVCPICKIPALNSESKDR